MIPDVWPFVVMVLAAARLTRLVVADTILDRPRDAITDCGYSWFASLITCPWCTGFWVSAFVVASWVAWGDTLGWEIPATVLAVSYAQALLNTRVEED